VSLDRRLHAALRPPRQHGASRAETRRRTRQSVAARARTPFGSRRMSSAAREIRVELGARSYPIRIGAGLLDLPHAWRDALSGLQVLVVSDSNVAPLYAQKVIAALAGKDAAQVVIDAGEQHKTLASCATIFDALARLRANRDACIVALGGGVVGDLAGFA